MGGSSNCTRLIGNVGVFLYNPNELLARMVKVEFDLVGGGRS